MLKLNNWLFFKPSLCCFSSYIVYFNIIEYKRSKFESLIRSKFDGRDEELAKTETQVDFTIYNIPSDRRFSSVLETFFSPDALYIMVLDANEELYYTEPTTNHLYQVTKTGGTLVDLTENFLKSWQIVELTHFKIVSKWCQWNLVFSWFFQNVLNEF